MADFGTLIGADWSIDRATKKIAYIGADHGATGETYATVIDFHRWLQSLAYDQIAVGDDELDITNTDPSRRSTDNIITLINGYTLEETGLTPASEHLYDGSIIESDGDTVWDGIVNFGNSDVVIQVTQNELVLSDDWWNLSGGVGVNANAAQGISHRFMIKVRDNGVDIDGRRLLGTTRVLNDIDQKTFNEFRINGTSRGNNVLALTNSDDLNNQNTATDIGLWGNITNTEGYQGLDVNDNSVDEYYYSQWTDDDSPNRGINDFYERLKWLTRDGSASTLYGLNGEVFRGITHNFTYTGTDPGESIRLVWGTLVDHGAVTGGPFQVGEAVVEDTATPVWKGRVVSVDGTNTSLIVVVTSGTVGNTESFTGATSGAQATTTAAPTAVVSGGGMQTLAVDAVGNEAYVQVLSGPAPSTSTIVYLDTDHTTTLTTSTGSTERTVSTPFVGASTGSAIIGAYGVGFALAEITNADSVTALDGNPYSRPNLVTNTVSGLNISPGQEDYVFVAPWNTASADVGQGVGYDLNGDPVVQKDQLSLSGPVTAADVGTITVQEAIPADTPSFGTIRVTDDNGFERWIPYTSWTGSAFTVDTLDSNGFGPIGDNNDFDTVNAANGNDVYITYLDRVAGSASHSFQSTYVSDRDLVALVRNGGTSPIIQFIAEWSLTASNQTLNAIRTTDA